MLKINNEPGSGGGGKPGHLKETLEVILKSPVNYLEAGGSFQR